MVIIICNGMALYWCSHSKQPAHDGGNINEDVGVEQRCIYSNTSTSSSGG